MDSQNDPSTKCHYPRVRMGSNELLKRLDSAAVKSIGLSGLVTTHWFHLPLPVYLLLFLLSKAGRPYDCSYLAIVVRATGNTVFKRVD